MMHWARRRVAEVAFSMGLDKSGTQTAYGSYVTIGPWVARSGYPDTVITSNGILVPAGLNVTIAGQIQWGTSDTGQVARIFNATTSETLATAPGASSAFRVIAPFTYTPTVESVIVLQGFADSTLSDREIVQAGSGTYLTVVKT